MKLSTNHEKNKTTFRHLRNSLREGRNNWQNYPNVPLGGKQHLRKRMAEISLNKTIDLTKNMSAMSIPKTPDKSKAIKSNALASTPAKK